MMFCQKCVTKLVDGRCPRCNPAGESKSSWLHEVRDLMNTPRPANLQDQDAIVKFLNFGINLTPAQVKGMYIPVSVAIVIGMLIAMFSGGAGMFFLGAIGGVVVLVLFRIACELLILLRCIHDKLSEADSKTETE